MTEEAYDSIGVVIAIDKNGRFSASRVYINGGVVAKEVVLTTGRAASWAMKEALISMNRIINDWTSNRIAFEQPPPKNMFAGEK